MNRYRDADVSIQLEHSASLLQKERSGRHSQSDYGSDSDETSLNDSSSSSRSSSGNKGLFKSSSPSQQVSQQVSSAVDNDRHFSSRKVKLIVVSFGFRLLFTSILWDHFVHQYHDLLMTPTTNPNVRVYASFAIQ
jgi:hypothetical protein